MKRVIEVPSQRRDTDRDVFAGATAQYSLEI